MGSFGSTAPKLVIGGRTLNVDYAVLEESPIYDNYMHENKLTQVRKVDTFDFNLDVTIRVNIWQESDPYNKFLTYQTYLHRSDVVVHRHRDGRAYKNSGGTDVSFYFRSIEHDYLFAIENNVNFEDVILLKLQSTEPVNWKQTADQ